jgi:tetratricopeptide (TPR) repeat protein
MEWKMIFVVTAIICGVIGIILYVHAYCNGNKKESVIGIAAFVVSILLGLASFVDKPAPFSLEVAQKLADERLTEEVAIQKTTIEELHKRLAEKDLPEYMQVVKELFDKGEYAKAIARLDAYKKEKDAEFYIFTAQLYIANYQFKEAGEHYRKAVEIFPSYDNTFAAARFYQDLNRFNEAKE